MQERKALVDKIIGMMKQGDFFHNASEWDRAALRPQNPLSKMSSADVQSVAAWFCPSDLVEEFRYAKEKGEYDLFQICWGRIDTAGRISIFLNIQGEEGFLFRGFLSQLSLVAAMAAVNNMIRKYGALDPVFGQEQYAQIPMAVVGIVMKFFQIVISIVVGMAAGCIPIVGFNMGAGKRDRVRELFTRLLAAEAGVGAVALLIVELFPRQQINIFGAANESIYDS